MRMAATDTWILTRHWLFSLREPQVDMKTPGGSRANRSAGKHLESWIESIPEYNRRTPKGDVREYALYSAAQVASF